MDYNYTDFLFIRMNIFSCNDVIKAKAVYPFKHVIRVVRLSLPVNPGEIMGCTANLKV